MRGSWQVPRVGGGRGEKASRIKRKKTGKVPKEEEREEHAAALHHAQGTPTQIQGDAGRGVAGKGGGGRGAGSSGDLSALEGQMNAW